MKMTIKNQKGFIQIPLLIWIVVGVLVVSGVSYLGFVQYKANQGRQAGDIKTQELLQQQEQALTEAQKQIDKLKQDSEATKGKQATLEQKVTSEQQKPKPKDLSISALEISNYIGGVTQVNCTNSEGSGFLMNLDKGYVTVTNDHVTAGNNQCSIMPEDSSGEGMGHYQLDLTSPYQWNSYTDITILKMSVSPAAQSWSKPIASLNFNLSNLRSCPSKMSVDSPVVVIGYPAFGKQQVQTQGYSAEVVARQVTEGIVSGHDTSVESPIGNLPYANYYVSAKIDSGNSGGVALSKDSNGLCLLGVATWVALGHFETQGVVQNILNIMYTQ